MSYESIEQLPNLIRERLDLSEFVDTNIDLGERFHFTDVQQRALMILENDIFILKETPSNLPALLAQKLVVDQQTAEKIAVELWGNYFLLFQDFLCPKDTALSERSVSNGSRMHVDQLIAKHGGNLAAYQERAKKLLAPGRPL